MKRTIFNQKGGVGKTSITCNLAAAFSVLGRRTLVIDLDAQANSTGYLLGARKAEIGETVADFFSATLDTIRIFDAPLGTAVYSTNHPRLDVIPASGALADLQPKLEARYKVFKLAQAIDKLIAEKRYDEILIDTPPALNVFTMSALMASDAVLIPYDCDTFSAEGLDRVLATIAEVKADHRPQLTVDGIVINQYQAQARLPQAAIAKLAARGERILEPWLSTSIAMRESHAQHSPLPFLRPRHKLTLEFMTLAENLLRGKTESARRPANARPKSPTQTTRKRTSRSGIETQP